MNSIVIFMVSPYDSDHESKIKVGTVQQNNNNLLRRNNLHTKTMQSIDTMSIPQERGGGHLPNKGR